LGDEQSSLASSAQILASIPKQLDEKLGLILADFKKEVSKVLVPDFKAEIQKFTESVKIKIDLSRELLNRADEFQLMKPSNYHPSLIVRGFNTKHSALAEKLAKELFKPEDYVTNPGETGFTMKKKRK
jgi:hypothetical protein